MRALVPGGGISPNCDSFDTGRLQICRPFVDVFRENGLADFESLWNLSGGTVVRKIGSRETVRITLTEGGSPQEFYLKRFGTPRWRDQLRTLLHFGRPVHGAAPEWEAIHAFIALEIPTVVPVALGQCGVRSLLLTEALPAHETLLEFVGGRTPPRCVGDGSENQKESSSTEHAFPVTNGSFVETDRSRSPRSLLEQVARMARTMHGAGYHHQDFYLNHLLLCGDRSDVRAHLIDLGRVRRQQPLKLRWIIKDLAQLDFSAQSVPVQARLRFLRLYLGRPFTAKDRELVAKVTVKSRRIASHTAKHNL